MSRATVAASLIAVTQIFAPAAHAESPEAARAREQLEPYRQVPKFQAPGEAFDARACMKGKSILSIPASSAVPFIKTIQESIEKLAGEIGFTYKPWENQGQVTQWVQGFDYAINNKFQLIELLAGADPRFVEPQVKAAKAAGLMVVAAHLTGYEQPIPGGATGVVPIDYKRAGGLLADWAIWKTDGKANASVMGVSDVLSTDSMFSGVKEEFAKCPNCKANYMNVSIPEMAVKTQSMAQGALTADPNIDYMNDPDL
jgi:ribose transport system substrate-binding protein